MAKASLIKLLKAARKTEDYRYIKLALKKAEEILKEDLPQEKYALIQIVKALHASLELFEEEHPWNISFVDKVIIMAKKLEKMEKKQVKEI